MTIPEWLTPGAYGFAAGGAVLAIVGFSWGGWMTERGATAMASEHAASAVTAALVPFCIELARVDPDRIAKLATIQDAAGFRRRDAMLATGWATVPGTTEPDRSLASACMDGLDLDAS